MFKTLFKLKLHWQILIALALAVVAGIFAGKTLFTKFFPFLVHCSSMH